MRKPEDRYDVIVVGAGPGGYSAAGRAGRLGLKTCVIEQDTPGGVCLNWGCVPTKNLIHQAGIFHARLALEAMGGDVDTTRFDYGYVHDQSREAVQTLVTSVERFLKAARAVCIRGTAKIVSRNTVVLDDSSEITGKQIIIATGSRPRQVSGFEFDGNQVLSSRGILSLRELPESLVILGAGAIGCEFAYIMNRFGVRVSLVEMESQILPGEDARAALILERSFKKSGIEVMTGTRAESLEKSPRAVMVTVSEKGDTKKRIEARKVLCAFGRTPNTDSIGLDNIGVATDEGFIPVGDYNQTKVSGVYAVGDVVKTPLLAHVAAREGEIAAEHIAGRATTPRIDLNLIPSAVYCEPQVAGFGLREQQAKGEGISYKKAMLPYRSTGKAVAEGMTEGMFKVLYDPDTEEILGAHIVGYNATELIHEILLARAAGLCPGDIARMIHAHPTLSEGIMELMRMVDPGWSTL